MMIISRDYEEMIRKDERERMRRISRDRLERKRARKKKIVSRIFHVFVAVAVIVLSCVVTFSPANYDIITGKYDGSILVAMCFVSSLLLFGGDFLLNGDK